jgi:RNA polymerase sigma-70 factor (ECF subfamily)
MLDTRITLLRRTRDLGDAQSWDEFHAIYRPLIFAYLRSWGIKEHDANDLSQVVFSWLVAILPGFELDRSRGRFRTYLWTLARNAWISELRGKKVRDGAEEEWKLRVRQADEFQSRRLDELANLERRRNTLEAVLPRVLANTSETARKCFEGRVVLRRPAAEIAIELGISSNCVFVHASRVLKEVRRLCAEIEGAQDDA